MPAYRPAMCWLRTACSLSVAMWEAPRYGAQLGKITQILLKSTLNWPILLVRISFQWHFTKQTKIMQNKILTTGKVPSHSTFTLIQMPLPLTGDYSDLKYEQSTQWYLIFPGTYKDVVYSQCTIL